MANGINGKHFSKIAIYRHFLNLPEAQRIRILQRYLTPKSIFECGASAYNKALLRVREMPRDQAMAWLDDPGKCGASREALIARCKHYCFHFMDEADSLLPDNPTDADMLYALIMAPTMFNRLAELFRDVEGKPREEYQKQGLADLNTIQKLSGHLGNPENIVEGKSLDDFLEEVSKDVDLSNAPSAVEELRQGIRPDDPNWKEKLRQAAQVLLIQPQGKFDPVELGSRLAGDDWEDFVSPQFTMRLEKEFLPIDKLIARAKDNIEDFTKTPEEKLLFQEAALQNCREAKRVYRERDFKGEAGENFARFTNELQEEIAKHYLTRNEPKALCNSLAEEYLTLTKTKSGFLLSSTNTPEHNAMTKHLRLFNAKLALLQGRQIDNLVLNPEEAKTVRESDLNTLYDNARRGCYNYGCLKTKNGKGGFIHDAGEERFNANMRTLTHLHELGRQLRLGDPAALLRDEVQCQLLENRRNTRWLEQHAADLAAKTIYAQKLLNEGQSWDRQYRRLNGEALEAQVEKIKNQPSFQRMVRSAGPKGLADAMIKGVSHLAELYGQAVHNAEANGEKPEKTEIAPKSLKAKADYAALTPPQ